LLIYITFSGNTLSTVTTNGRSRAGK